MQSTKSKSLLPGLLSAILLAGTAHAETWVAKCHNLEFRYDRGAKKAAIFMQTIGNQVFEIATGPIGLDNGVALRATVTPPPTADDDPINEIGLNKSRNIVYLVRHHTGSNEVKDGVFCETPITVTP